MDGFFSNTEIFFLQALGCILVLSLGLRIARIEYNQHWRKKGKKKSTKGKKKESPGKTEPS